jgi:hypothetical protein
MTVPESKYLADVELARQAILGVYAHLTLVATDGDLLS